MCGPQQIGIRLSGQFKKADSWTQTFRILQGGAKESAFLTNFRSLRLAGLEGGGGLGLCLGRSLHLKREEGKPTKETEIAAREPESESVLQDKEGESFRTSKWPKVSNVMETSRMKTEKSCEDGIQIFLDLDLSFKTQLKTFPPQGCISCSTGQSPPNFAVRNSIIAFHLLH